MTHGGHDVFTEAAWEERYRSAPAVWSGRPNAQLVAEASDLPPGTALDVGSGEGADVRWLAARGWRVTGVDFSTVALERAAQHTAEFADRITWTHADVTTWTPEGGFDLVSAQYMHLPLEPRVALFGRLAAAVVPGGTLLVVGHDASDLETTVHRPDVPGMFWSAQEIVDSLDPAMWNVVVAQARPRVVHDGEGREVAIADLVVRAARLPS